MNATKLELSGYAPPAAPPSFADPQQAVAAAGARLNAGQPAAALALIAPIVERYPDLAAALQIRGLSRMQLGELDGALRDLQQALALLPGNADIELARASALRRVGRRDEALAVYDRLLARGVAPAGLQNNRGTCLLDLGRHEEALIAFETVLATHPRDEIAAANRATVLSRLGRQSEALALLRQLLIDNPKSASVRRQLVILLLELGQSDEAAAQADAGATAHRPWPDGWLLVAQHRAQHGALGGALEAAGQAVAAAPEQILPRRMLVSLLLMAGRADLAEIHCRAGLGLVPDDPDLTAQLPQILAQTLATSLTTTLGA